MFFTAAKTPGFSFGKPAETVKTDNKPATGKNLFKDKFKTIKLN